MKICVQTNPMVPRYGIDKGFEIIKAAGFDGVDFNFDCYCSYNDMIECKIPDIFTDEAKKEAFIEDMIASSKKHGIEIHQCHAPFPSYIKDKPEANKAILEALKASVEMCGRAGCKILVVHPAFNGSARYPTKRSEEWQWSTEMYEALIPSLKKYGVTCCLENMWGQDWITKKIYSAICTDIPEACVYIDKLNEIAGEKLFGFCLDIGHLNLLGLDPAFAMEQLGDRLVTFHIHDVSCTQDSHVCPYIGVVGWERFIKGVKDCGYNGALSFETANMVIELFKPQELMIPALHLIYEVGKYFDDRISEKIPELH